MQTEQANTGWTPSTESEEAAIQEQLDRLLLDPSFNRSKRYSCFLKFVVERKLTREIDSIKERTLGIEVFGRSPSYDTTEDAIVRVTASEIRKRLLGYYAKPAHREEIRLLLPSGSYVPYFELPLDYNDVNPAAPARESDATRHLQTSSTPFPAASRFETGAVGRLIQFLTRRRRVILFAVSIASLLFLSCFGAFFLRKANQQSPVETFWQPVIGSSGPLIICVGDQVIRADNSVFNVTTTGIDNAVILGHLTSTLSSYGKPLQIQGQAETTFSDLGRGPVILIGAFNNEWTLRLTNPLRFHFVEDRDRGLDWIEDRQAPTRRDWTFKKAITKTVENPQKDFGIVARFVDANTNQVTVVAAGLGHNGTAVAGQFLLSPQYLSDFARIAPGQWRSRNVEIVFETMVLDGHPGPPHIDAIHVW